MGLLSIYLALSLDLSITHLLDGPPSDYREGSCSKENSNKDLMVLVDGCDDFLAVIAHQ